jgi:hypothetical protein
MGFSRDLSINTGVPRHIWPEDMALLKKVGDTDLKGRFQVSWCEIINYSISTIIQNI